MEAVNVLQKLNPHSRILSEQDNIAFQHFSLEKTMLSHGLFVKH